MIIHPKTKLEFDDSWIEKLKFEEHTDTDLAGHVSAISIKSETGSVFDFYRTSALEKPENFKYTALYYNIPECEKLTDYFKLQTTRVRIHRQLPGQKIPMHTDDNNIEAKSSDDYRLRMLTALSEDEDFIYQFSMGDEVKTYSLKKGQSLIFDPDKVAHGMQNNSKDKIRYCLVQVYKAIPLTEWMKNFIYKERTINIDERTTYWQTNNK